MKQYIDKAAVVAEIEDWRDKIKKGIFSIPLTGRDRASATFEYEILGRVIDFLDTLEVKKEPISEDLEEAARRIATRHSHITGDIYYANDAWFFKKGAQWQKKQMMKDAVYGLVCGHDDNSPAWIDLNLLNKPDVKVGEEIKLIIIKEE